MISSFFITVGASLLAFAVSALPLATSLPTAISDSLADVGSSINAVSYLIPVGSLFGALFIVVGYEAVIWLFHAFMWVWKRIPFIGR